MERSCAKDFGKELGAVHEGIITLRNLGLTTKGWEKMKDDKELARKVVQLLEGQKEFWLEKILAQEWACHLAFFGQEFGLTEFVNTLRKYGESKIRFWQGLGLEPHFLPRITMGQLDDYPGWKIKPEKWYYEKLDENKIFRSISGCLEVEKNNPPNLEGIIVLIDTRLKPSYDDGKQVYKNDNLLGSIIERLRRSGKIAKYEYDFSRFGISTDEWENQIKSVLAGKLGLNESQLRLERAIEANVIPRIYPYMPRKDDGDTNTWVWYEEYFEDRGIRLHGGRSDFGGLARVSYNSSGNHWDDKSFRPLAVL